MNINEAQAVIAQSLAELNAAATARGKPDVVFIQFNPRWTAVSSGGEIRGLFSNGEPLADMLAKAHAAIDALPDPHTYDAEFTAPLYLLSEQHAQAAE